MVAKLFIDGITPSDNYYSVIRDKPHCAHYKSCMEKMWTVYYPYADKDYQKQLTQDFHARFWEMYLTCTLIEKSFNVYPKFTKSEGPDILIQDSQRSIYLEAVTPSEGNESNKDRVPKMPLMKVTRVPDEQITLRYCSVIADKYKKYNTYLNRGIILSSDAYVIALNSCKIDQAIMETDLPRIVKSVLPIGYQQVNISKIPGVEPSWHYQYIDKICRSSSSLVNTDLFLDRDYEGLSGILYSRTDLFNKPPVMGDNFIFIHNPLAKNQIPHGYFKFGTEYSIKVKPKSFSFERKNW